MKKFILVFTTLCTDGKIGTWYWVDAIANWTKKKYFATPINKSRLDKALFDIGGKDFSCPPPKNFHAEEIIQ